VTWLAASPRSDERWRSSLPDPTSRWLCRLVWPTGRRCAAARPAAGERRTIKVDYVHRRQFRTPYNRRRRHTACDGHHRSTTNPDLADERMRPGSPSRDEAEAARPVETGRRGPGPPHRASATSRNAVGRRRRPRPSQTGLAVLRGRTGGRGGRVRTGKRFVGRPLLGLGGTRDEYVDA
jgi:hypothetical protein